MASRRRSPEPTSPNSTRPSCFPARSSPRWRPLKAFYPAEDYHQDFLSLNPNYPYIVYNDLPKIANLKQLFPGLYSDKPVLVSEAKS